MSTLTVGIWEEPAGDYPAFLLESAGIPVVRVPAHQSLRAVRAQSVQVGMVPALAFLRDPDDFQIVPFAGLVTTSYPFARWIIQSQMDKMRTASVDPAYPQEALLLRILANEHYQKSLSMVARPFADLESFLDGVDTGLVVGDPDASAGSGVALDLGREWYELTTRPFPWGLLVSLKGEIDPHEVEPIQIAFTDESGPSRYANTRSLTTEMEDYIFHGVQRGFDEEALLGLQAFATNCFYYGVIDEIPDVTFFSTEGQNGTQEGDEA